MLGLSGPLTSKETSTSLNEYKDNLLDSSWLTSHFSSVTNMLMDLNIPSLELRRQVSSIILLYKIVHNLIDISPIDLLCHLQHQRIQPEISSYICKDQSIQQLIFPRSITLWNSLAIITKF